MDNYSIAYLLVTDMLADMLRMGCLCSKQTRLWLL